MLTFYTVFTVGILLLSFSLSVNLFNKSFEKEIKESNQRLLTQVQIYVDKNLLDKVISIINENFLDPSSGSYPLNFIHQNNQPDTETVLGSVRSLSNTLINHDYIHSICLYRKSDDTILSTDQGLRLNSFSPEVKISSIPYTNILKGLVSSSESKLWISPFDNKDNFIDTPMITYVQSIPLYTSFQNSNGCIILNFNQDLLFSQIYEIYGQNGDLMVIDSGGRLFAHSDPSKLMGKFELEENTKTIFLSNEGFDITKINGSNYGITWTRSSLNDWVYVSIVPVEALNKQAAAVQKIILMILGIILIFSFIMLNFITARLYSPLNVLTRKAQDSFNIANKGENELSYINNAFTFLSNKVDDMEETIKNNQDIIKYKTMIDILYGNIGDADDIKNSLKLFNSSLECNLYAIIIVEIDRNIFSRLSFEQREFVTLKANELISLFFSDKCNCICICHPSNCIVAILNFDEQNTVLPAFNNLLGCLENKLRINFNIAVSKLNDQVSALTGIYTVTRDYLKYSYIYNYNNVFTHKIIERYEATSGDFDSNTINQMESFLKSGKAEKFKSLLSEQITRIKSNGYSYSYTQNLLLQTIGLISKVCREHGITSELLEKSRIMFNFNSISNLDECIRWINSIIDQYYESVNIRNISIDHEFIQKIVDYVSDHIANQISLNSVSDEFNIGSSHLSRLFKDSLDISFSDYILDKKLEKAAELFATEGDKSIAEIAEKLGYLTPAYFSKIFKGKYGMTPTLYKKKKLNEK